MFANPVISPFLRLWSPFSLARASLSLYPSLFFYPYLRRARPLPLSVLLSLPLPLFRPRPSVVATLPSLFVIVSSTRSCSPAFAQALNAIYDHRYVLSRHIRSGWSLAFSLPPSTPSPSPLRSLFLMLLFSVFLLARLRFSPRSIRPLLEIRFPSSFQYLYFNTILIIFIFNTI